MKLFAFNFRLLFTIASCFPTTVQYFNALSEASEQLDPTLNTIQSILVHYKNIHLALTLRSSDREYKRALFSTPEVRRHQQKVPSIYVRRRYKHYSVTSVQFPPIFFSPPRCYIKFTNIAGIEVAPLLISLRDAQR